MSVQRIRGVRAAILLLTVALTAACGSTFPLQNGQLPVALNSEGQPVVLEDGMNDGLGLPSEGAAPGTVTGGTTVGGVPVAGGTTTGGSTTTTRGGTVAPGSTSGGDAPGAGSPQPGEGTGTDNGTQPSGNGEAPGTDGGDIKIGFEYSGNTTAANAAIGANVSGGDPRANYNALIDYYNERGGIAGRKIVPEWFEYDANSDIPQQQQEACSHFTQDVQVYAVLLIDSSDQYVNCLAQNGVGAWGSEQMTGADEDMLAKYPNFMMPSALPVSAAARLIGPGLKQAGYFQPEALDKSTTLGLVTFDEPRYRKAVTQNFIPALRRAGEVLDEAAYVHYAKSTSDVGPLSADMSSVVLRFRQQGVDHVMFLEENALIAFTFLQQAERQEYRPQYGFNSTSGGQLFIDSGLAPAGQMTNSRLVAWQPLFDVPSRYVKPWAAYRECIRIYSEAGIQFEDGNSRGIAVAACAGMSFLHAALAKTTGPLTLESMRAGGEALGTSWQSPWNNRTSFGPRRHYGTAHYLTAAHDVDCNCFKPNNPMRPIP